MHGEYRVLVDHGVWRNFGDLAMLTGVCNAYRDFGHVRCAVLSDRLSGGPPPFSAPIAEAASLGRSIRAGVQQRIRQWEGYLRLCPAGVRTSIESRMILGGIKRNGKAPHDYSVDEERLDQFVQPFDGLHLAGGGYITDAFPYAILEKTCLIRAFHRQGKPIVVTGQQFGPFRSRAAEAAWKDALQMVDFVGLREATCSYQVCRRAGVLARTVIMGDDSFGLAAADDAEVASLLERHGLSRSRFLAVNLRISSYSHEHAMHAREFARLVKAVAAALHVPAVVVPICVGKGECDIVAGRRLQTLIKELVMIDDDCLTPALVKGILKQAYAGIGASYHFCTFCLGQGVPALCTVAGKYYLQKAAGLASFWERPEILVRLGTTGSASGLSRMARFLESDAVRRQLHARAEQALATWNACFAQAASTLMSRKRIAG